MLAAVDIGGTKTLVAVFDKDGRVAEKLKFLTPSNYNDFKGELAANVDKMSTKDFDRVIVAIPGKVNRLRGIGVAFGNEPWENVPIQADAEDVFQAPALIENDARLAALSEAILIKDKYHKALYITISTGIGAGLIIDGKIDPNFQDMEVGHIMLEHQGRIKKWEEFGSGQAFAKKFGKRVGDVPEDNAQAWYWFARNIAIGLIDLIATLTPEVIIFGGGAGAHLDRFQGRLEEELKLYETPLVTMPKLVVAKRPEEAVIYGCYEYAQQHK